MASQLQRGNLFDDIFREFAPGFFIKPLHRRQACRRPRRSRST